MRYLLEDDMRGCILAKRDPAECLAAAYHSCLRLKQRYGMDDDEALRTFKKLTDLLYNGKHLGELFGNDVHGITYRVKLGERYFYPVRRPAPSGNWMIVTVLAPDMVIENMQRVMAGTFVYRTAPAFGDVDADFAAPVDSAVMAA